MPRAKDEHNSTTTRTKSTGRQGRDQRNNDQHRHQRNRKKKTKRWEQQPETTPKTHDADDTKHAGYNSTRKEEPHTRKGRISTRDKGPKREPTEHRKGHNNTPTTEQPRRTHKCGAASASETILEQPRRSHTFVVQPAHPAKKRWVQKGRSKNTGQRIKQKPSWKHRTHKKSKRQSVRQTTKDSKERPSAKVRTKTTTGTHAQGLLRLVALVCNSFFWLLSTSVFCFQVLLTLSFTKTCHCRSLFVSSFCLTHFSLCKHGRPRWNEWRWTWWEDGGSGEEEWSEPEEEWPEDGVEAGDGPEEEWWMGDRWMRRRCGRRRRRKERMLPIVTCRTWPWGWQRRQAMQQVAPRHSNGVLGAMFLPTKPSNAKWASRCCLCQDSYNLIAFNWVLCQFVNFC